MERIGVRLDHDRQAHLGGLPQDLLVDLVSSALNVNQARWHAVGRR
jgi:hypothetical protein